MRYFLEIAYKGGNYHGWQIQPNAHSIQAALEAKLSLVLNHPLSLTASGRTDAGVHALQQIVHMDTDRELSRYEHLHKFNLLLPPDIAIINIFKVSEEAHARFDAIWRSYAYYISALKEPFRAGLYDWNHRDYDVALMNEAAQLLLKYEDFQSFSKVKTEVNHFRCQIKEAYWQKEGANLVFHITANRFLRGMVRAIVGTLLEVGQKKMNLQDFEQVILSRDRKNAGAAAPPQGLFLTQVIYPYTLIPIE